MPCVFLEMTNQVKITLHLFCVACVCFVGIVVRWRVRMGTCVTHRTRRIVGMCDTHFMSRSVLRCQQFPIGCVIDLSCQSQSFVAVSNFSLGVCDRFIQNQSFVAVSNFLLGVTGFHVKISFSRSALFLHFVACVPYDIFDLSKLKGIMSKIPHPFSIHVRKNAGFDIECHGFYSFRHASLISHFW